MFLLISSSNINSFGCALMHKGEIIDVELSQDAQQSLEVFAHRIGEMKKRNHAVGKITDVFVDIGPGSFTGVRFAASYIAGTTIMDPLVKVHTISGFDIMTTNFAYCLSSEENLRLMSDKANDRDSADPVVPNLPIGFLEPSKDRLIGLKDIAQIGSIEKMARLVSNPKKSEGDQNDRSGGRAVDSFEEGSSGPSVSSVLLSTLCLVPRSGRQAYAQEILTPQNKAVDADAAADGDGVVDDDGDGSVGYRYSSVDNLGNMAKGKTVVYSEPKALLSGLGGVPNVHGPFLMPVNIATLARSVMILTHETFVHLKGSSLSPICYKGLVEAVDFISPFYLGQPNGTQTPDEQYQPQATKTDH